MALGFLVQRQIQRLQEVIHRLERLPMTLSKAAGDDKVFQLLWKIIYKHTDAARLRLGRGTSGCFGLSALSGSG